MTHQRIILSGPTIDGPPGLPPELIGTLTDETLADIEAASDPCPPGFEGIGYWRIQPADPIPEGKVSVDQYVELIEGQPKWVHTLEDAPPPSSAEIDAERDRRIDGGITFNGVVYQTRPADRENLAGASTLALSAMVAGAQPGDLRWHGGDSDFAWIAEDNSVNTMDAQTLFALGAAVANRKAALIFAARALKDMDPVPRDFADDQYWP